MSDGLGDEDAVRLSPGQADQLAALLRGQGVRTLQLDTVKGRFAVTLMDVGEVPDSVAESGTGPAETVKAASVGEFLTGHPSRSGPLAYPGARVAPGDVLGLVRTGVVFAPVVLPPQDPRPATVLRVLVPAGSLVGYGTPLFELERH